MTLQEQEPINKDKDQYQEIIDRISSAESAVGIDAQLTHAIIIDYLRLLNKRVKTIENRLK